MRKSLSVLATLVIFLGVTALLLHAQAPAGRGASQQREAPPPARGPAPAPVPVFTLQDNFLQWRLLPSEKAYEAIDGKHLMETVNAYAGFSRTQRAGDRLSG